MFGSDRIQAFSKTEWFPVAVDLRTDYVKMLTRAKTNLNDSHMDIGNLLEDNNDGFDLEKDSLRILPYDNYMHNSLTFELSRTRIDYTRTVYSVFDFLGDIGGFSRALKIIFEFAIFPFVSFNYAGY